MTVRQGSTRLLLSVLLAAALVVPAAGASAARRGPTVYAGLGTWLDYHDRQAMRHPAREVAAMARDGVRTLYLETGNYSHRVDVIRPRAIGRYIDAAHAAGMRVVAWYLPSFANPPKDERRILAAVDFRSPNGGRFDGFALDIEATVVRRQGLRNRRLLQLSAWLRSAVGAGYPLGAVTPSPIGMSPSYWPTLPYRRLAGFYDTFLPMAYSTLRGLHGAAATYSYLDATVAAIRARSGNPSLPIHLIGGLSDGMGASETAGFMRAVGDTRPVGYSLYAFPHTHRAAWTALRG